VERQALLRGVACPHIDEPSGDLNVGIASALPAALHEKQQEGIDDLTLRLHGKQDCRGAAGQESGGIVDCAQELLEAKPHDRKRNTEGAWPGAGYLQIDLPTLRQRRMQRLGKAHLAQRPLRRLWKFLKRRRRWMWRRRAAVNGEDGGIRNRDHREVPLVLDMHGRDTHVAHGITVGAEIDRLTVVLGDLNSARRATRRNLGRQRIGYGPGIPDLQLLGAAVVRVTDHNEFV
jgi:hypothetical protein